MQALFSHSPLIVAIDFDRMVNSRPISASARLTSTRIFAGRKLCQLKIIERYASAIRSPNLRSIERTTHSDSDIVGAVGLASKTDYLGALLLRFELGDNKAARECAGVLANRAHIQFPKLHPRTAVDIASALIAFSRSDVCPACNGLGCEVIPGTPTLSKKECRACRGTGKKRIDKQFPKEHMPVVDWMYAWVSRAKHEAAHVAAEKIGAV